jgi:PAS domain S-box-containing protein
LYDFGPRTDDAKPALRLAALGLAALVALCAFATISYTSALRWVEHTIEVRAELDDWLIALIEAQSRARGYAISADPAYLEPYEKALEQGRASGARLRSLAADNPTQLAHLAAAERHAEAAAEATQELMSAVRTGERREAQAKLASIESRKLLDTFRQDWRRIRDEEERLLEARKDMARGRALLMIAGASVLALASIGLLAFAWQIQNKRAEALDRLAREARARLHTISDVAAALSKARTRADVIDVVLDQGMLMAGADTCTLYLLDETETTLELLGERGVAPDIVPKLRKLSATSGNPEAFAAFRAGSSTWVESEKEYRALFPKLAGLKVEGPRAKAFWSVPFIVEGRPAGLLGMGSYRERIFSEDDRALVETLAKQCGEALVRATRYDGEDRARRWFTTTLRSIGDAVIATDGQGQITFMNPIAEALTGWNVEEARGKPLDEVFVIYSETTRKAVESPVAKVLREGKIVGLANHTLLRSRHGREVPIDDSGAPIRSETGELFGVVLVFRDVSREKAERGRREFLTKAGEALVASLDYEVTLATIARLAVPVIADWCAIDVVEPGSNVIRRAAVEHVDPSKLRLARELTERYPPDPNARNGAPEVIRSGKAELYAEIPEAMLQAGARDADHLALLRELRLGSALVVPLKARGHTLGAMTFVYAESQRHYGDEDLAFAEDFARRAAMALENSLALKQVENARIQERRLRDEAEIASRAKDEFLAMVSHELRTPLNAILGWTVILRRRTPNEETDRALSVIERNALAQAKLIEDVLDISRIISGKLALTLGPTHIADAVTAAIETVTPAAQAKNIALVVDHLEPALTITADADRVQQIVWNVLSNAVKFTPKGGTVTVRAFREGSDISISVRDSGEGIERDALPFVFEAFHQADASTTRRHGGLGLGLAIVKQLVSAHGGTVEALSEGRGKGATFVVHLPARSAIPAIRRAARAESASDAPPSKPAPSRLDGLRVLVIDDEADSLELVAQVLREQGAEVHAATSARTALETFSRVRPDVVVSDIGMPGEDGYSLIRKIRSMPADLGGRTPAVALTAYAREEDAQRAFNAGYQMHLTKPVEPDRLATTVSNLGGRTVDSA